MRVREGEMLTEGQVQVGKDDDAFFPCPVGHI